MSPIVSPRHTTKKGFVLRETCFSSYSRGQYNNTVFDLHVNALYDFLYVNNLEADAIKDGMIVVPALRSGFDSNSPGAQAFTGP